MLHPRVAGTPNHQRFSQDLSVIQFYIVSGIILERESLIKES